MWNQLSRKTGNGLRARVQKRRQKLFRAGALSCSPDQSFECVGTIAARVSPGGYRERRADTVLSDAGSYGRDLLVPDYKTGCR